MNKKKKLKILVLGVGNLLLGDEGVGIHIIQKMKRENLPQHVELIDGSTAGIDLLYWLEEAGYAIIVDCVELGEKPGEIIRVQVDELLLDTPAQIISLHDINLKEVLLLAKNLIKPPPTIILGVQPEVIGYQTELSSSVQKVLPRLIEIIKQEISSFN